MRLFKNTPQSLQILVILILMELSVLLFTPKLETNMASSHASKEVSNRKRLAIYLQVPEKFDGESLPYGDFYVVVNKYGVTWSTLNRHWRLFKQSDSP